MKTLVELNVVRTNKGVVHAQLLHRTTESSDLHGYPVSKYQRLVLALSYKGQIGEAFTSQGFNDTGIWGLGTVTKLQQDLLLSAWKREFGTEALIVGRYSSLG